MKKTNGARQVKITAGKFRGRKITTPGGATHPMGERERLALFNMIGEYLPGARVIDAYAGSGTLGIEALSRGARKALFIEQNPKAMRVIVENCQTLALKETETSFYWGSVKDFCKKQQQESVRFFDTKEKDTQACFEKAEIILADPPYDCFQSEEINILASSCLKTGGILVLSHPEKAPELSKFKLLKTKQYARAHLSVYVSAK